MALGDTLADQLLNLIKGNNQTAPTSIYLAFHSDDPGRDGSNELSGGAYARTQLTQANFSAISGDPRKISYDAAGNSPTATADWNGGSPFQYFSIWDAASAGNFLMGGVMDLAITVLNGQQVTWGSGDIEAVADQT